MDSSLSQLPTDAATELSAGSYLLTFPAHEVANAIAVRPDWAQRAAEAIAADDDRVKASFVDSGFVNLPGQVPGAFYQVRVKLEPVDGVGTEGLVAITVGALVASLLIALAIGYATVIAVQKIVEDVTESPAGQNLATGFKWFGLAAVLAVIVIGVSIVT